MCPTAASLQLRRNETVACNVAVQSGARVRECPCRSHRPAATFHCVTQGFMSDDRESTLAGLRRTDRTNHACSCAVSRPYFHHAARQTRCALIHAHRVVPQYHARDACRSQPSSVCVTRSTFARGCSDQYQHGACYEVVDFVAFDTCLQPLAAVSSTLCNSTEHRTQRASTAPLRHFVVEMPLDYHADVPDSAHFTLQAIQNSSGAIWQSASLTAAQQGNSR